MIHAIPSTTPGNAMGARIPISRTGRRGILVRSITQAKMTVRVKLKAKAPTA